jgi:hypothetical protein
MQAGLNYGGASNDPAELACAVAVGVSQSDLKLRLLMVVSGDIAARKIHGRLPAMY